jgi:hypothetical protein
MRVRSSFVHLAIYTTMVKIKFKMDTLGVRLIILKFVYYTI